MSILITGGAGFVGRHTAKLLNESGYELILLDSLMDRRAEIAQFGKLIVGNVADTDLVRKILREQRVEAVLHLAASAHVGESMLHPKLYFRNNVQATISLMESMVLEGIRQLVFASSSSVYGDLGSMALVEHRTPEPVSPYGESKLQSERMLTWYAHAYGVRWVALRYFNVAGADLGLGEDLRRSSRIIPRTVNAVVNGGPPVQVFGTDLATPDGTAVRDYVHVRDVARANQAALRYVLQDNPGRVINIGSGVGTSVLSILEAVGQQFQALVPSRNATPRPGDPAFAIADISQAEQILSWRPRESAMPEIVSSVFST